MAVKRIQLHKGQVFSTKNHGDLEVLYHNNSRDVGVRFIDTGFMVTGVQVGNVVRGNIKDILMRTVQGVGYLNTNEKVAKTDCYRYWHGMLERAYSEKYHATRPTYKDVEVCRDWHDFTEFRKWFEANYIKGYHLDKDILGNGKLYSPENCCFVPIYINCMITDIPTKRGDCPRGVSKRKTKGTDNYNGLYNVAANGIYLGRYDCPNKAHEVYKEFKEFLVHEVAESYYERGLISDRVRDGLYDWKVV